jgi:hypothetical protein
MKFTQNEANLVMDLVNTGVKQINITSLMANGLDDVLKSALQKIASNVETDNVVSEEADVVVDADEE